MNIFLIPIAAFLGIVALLILKDIKPDSLFKKILKVLIILFFLVAFVVVSFYMYTPKSH